MHIAPEHVLCQMAKGMHFHQHHELFFQIEGASHFFFPKEDLVLKRGELLMIPYGVPHCEFGSGQKTMENLVLLAKPPHWRFHLGTAISEQRPSIHQARTYRPDQHELILNQLDLLIETRRNNPLQKTVNGLLFAFLRMLESSKEVSKNLGLTEIFKPSLVDRCLDLVQSSYNLAECNVQYLARELQCSPAHLSRTFSSETGKGLLSVIIDHRMQQAKTLLKEGRFNVSQTAHSCGFEDVSHFVSSFKRTFGVTPKQFGLSSKEK